MIRRLTGHVVDLEGHVLTLDVSGVGYEVHTTLRDAATWQREAQAITIHIQTEVRDDAITLFGFPSTTDRSVFLKLRAVSGVGPTVALGALDTLGAVGVVSAVEQEDLAALARIPKVGKKLASRIALELKGQLSAPHGDSPMQNAVPFATSPDVLDQALTKLGYGRSEIERAQARLAHEGLTVDTPIAQRLRQALRLLSTP